MDIFVTGLPEGLSYDMKKNIISGILKDTINKTYTVNFKAVNSLGSAERKFDIVVGDEIALTPPMGWSSWICYKKNVTQDGVLKQAKALKSVGLDRYGYSYVNIDDGWQGNLRGGKYNAIMPDSEKFPDIVELSENIHDMGLKFGIYSTPWISSYAGYIGGSSNNEDGKWDKSMLINFKKKEIEGRASRHGKFKMDANDARQWLIGK
nr:putative Ig domain-containing protein [Bacteroides sp. AM54-2NS]